MKIKRADMRGRHGGHPLWRMSGLTLIELVIAVAVGIPLVGSILVLYLNAQESAAYMNSASRVQESGRFASDHLARTLRMARYDDPMTNGIDAVVPGLEGTTSADVSISMPGFTLKADTDIVKISHEGAPQVRDCQGVAVASDTWVTNTFAISDDDELICGTLTRVIDCGSGLCIGQQSTAAPLVIAEGIEDIDLRYGVDSDTDGFANRYVLESNVDEWSLVVSAKVTLLVNSVETVFAGTIHGCKSCDTFNPPSSNLLRAEFHTTVRFRNLLGI